jgi:geranylgeranylglycerol-phosphate geranylgeranyltransferase
VAAYIKLMRPVNCVIAGLSVGLGYYAARGEGDAPFSPALLLLMLSACLMTGFGNVLNDLFDRDTDAVNRPDRPLPAGTATVRTVFWFGNLLGLLGLVCARSVSACFFYMAATVAALLWAYNARLKRTVLYGNIVVALLTGFTLLYGGFLSQDWRLAAWPSLFAFLLNFAREIIKDMADVKGDRLSGCDTLPVRYGTLWAANIAAIILLTVIFLVPRPFFAGVYNSLYLILAELGVVVPAFILILLLFRYRESARRLNLLAVVLKGMMFAGLVAVLFGKRGAA